MNKSDIIKIIFSVAIYICFIKNANEVIKRYKNLNLDILKDKEES